MATNDATIVDPLLPQIQAAHEEMYRTLVYTGGEKKQWFPVMFRYISHRAIH
jgi:hypothetical protein